MRAGGDGKDGLLKAMVKDTDEGGGAAFSMHAWAPGRR